MPGLGRGDRWYTVNELALVAIGASTVQLRVVDGDPRMRVHLGFWTDGWRTFEYDSDRLATVRTVGAHSVIIDRRGEGSDPPHSALEGLVAGLRDASRDEARRLGADALSRPADAADRCELPGGPSVNAAAVSFAGVIDRARWSITLAADDRTVSSCERVNTGNGPPSEGSGGGSLSSLVAVDRVRFIGGVKRVVVDGRTFNIVAGDAPSATRTVLISFAGGQPIRAQVAGTGPTGDRRWFAAAFIDDSPGLTPSAVALDAAGKEVGRSATP